MGGEGYLWLHTIYEPLRHRLALPFIAVVLLIAKLCTMAEKELIGIFTALKADECLEIENPRSSYIHFEKGSFFKKYDTCIGKIYLTNKRLIILMFIMLEAKNMKLESAEQFDSAMGQWFDIGLAHIVKVSTPKKGLIRSVLERLPLIRSFIGAKMEELQIEYVSPMEFEKKNFFFGSKMVREHFVIVVAIDNKGLWNMKIQSLVAGIKK
jgi:hypothetical protein